LLSSRTKARLATIKTMDAIVDETIFASAK